MPGLFGIFYYRSANPRTLDALVPFLPVPREALIRDFRTGATANDVCAQTVRALRRLGIGKRLCQQPPSEPGTCGSARRSSTRRRQRSDVVEGV